MRRLVRSLPRATPNIRRQGFCHFVGCVVMMPSLWRESLGRVPIEAMANGIPVMASDRGALPETLEEAGFVPTIPERCTPSSGVVPTAQEVAPWVAIIEMLWDDPEFEAKHRRRALAEAERWGFDRLARHYEVLLHQLLSKDTRKGQRHNEIKRKPPCPHRWNSLR
jgi:glycosyltransferase involved in cell wall biosynthesis